MEGKIKAQRNSIGKFITYCEAVINMPEPNLTKGYLEAKNKIITEFWSKLDEANDEIVEKAESDDLLSNYFNNNEFDKAFSTYDKVSIMLQTKLEKYEKPPTQLGPVTLPANMILNANQDKSKLKLKPIDIPVFTGEYRKWISFRSLFDSMVHNNDKFDGLEKMHYLKSCVAGDAESLISQCDVTAEANPEAYQVITDRFHNEVILVDIHIMEILSQPNLISESSVFIKALMDNTANNLRALKTLKIDTTTWDPILLLLLVQKLDKSTRRLWEQTLKPKIRPTMKEFLDFLGTRFHALGCQQNFSFSIETENHQSNFQNYRKKLGREQSFSNGQMFPPRVHQNFHNSTNSSQRPCPICPGERHSIFTCENFRKAVPRTRIEMVNCAKLCKRCLRGHKTVCTHPEGCRECDGNHHTFLQLHHQEDRNSLRETVQEEGNKDSAVINSHHVSLQRSIANPTPAKIIKSHHVNTQIKEIQDENNQVDRYITPWDAPVLLATAIILVRSAKDNNFYPFRCLLDQASEASHISESAAQILGLNKKAISASISGLGGVSTMSASSIVNFEVGSKVNQSFQINVQAIVVPKVT